MTPLKIEIVSDVMCPWCVVGYKNLETALAELQTSIQADISWHAFELNPDMPIEGQNLAEHLMQKYGQTKAQSIENRERLTDVGKQAGFDFNFDENSIMINSFDCHRLLSWAKDHDKQTELKLALFKAHFSDKIYLNEQDALLKVVTSVGLSSEDAIALLKSNAYAEKVKTEQDKMRQLGISSVPTFIINEKYAINGGQAVETFKQALEQISRES
jgi:predicted DsbA family dithiol-disulfide isomerase